MANTGYLATLVNRLPVEMRTPMNQAFEHLAKYIRFGARADQEKAENLAGFRLDGTTHAVANTEFSIRHGLGTAPYLAIPVLPLDTVNATLPVLTVSRVADRERIYLTSATANASFSLYVEG